MGEEVGSFSTSRLSWASLVTKSLSTSSNCFVRIANRNWKIRSGMRKVIGVVSTSLESLAGADEGSVFGLTFIFGRSE
ncbi:uncharacterized protein G2W53_018997 [Senna tora]|uniref:Uncharacterized protein n=1 Tax=Senna tora TaxID=362788 RepID=A0A834TSW4_9FABA|nr:uncharacterized protein G2W53_018997 [Senna tora]